MAIEWVQLSESDLAATLSAPELQAFKSAATGVGQVISVADLLSQVQAEVEGYIAASDNPLIVPANSVPKTLARAALAIARYRLITRLPINAQQMLETRQKEYDDARSLLQAVASDRFVIGRADAATQTPARAKYGSSPRLFE